MLSLLLPALPGDHMGGHMGGGGRHHMFGALLLLLLVGAAVVLLIVALYRRPAGAWAGRPGPPPPTPPASPTAKAEEIVAERLARGEISPDDYRATLAALRADHASSV